MMAMDAVPLHDPAPLSQDTPKRFADFKYMKDTTLILGESMPSEEARNTFFNCLKVLIQITLKNWCDQNTTWVCHSRRSIESSVKNNMKDHQGIYHLENRLVIKSTSKTFALGNCSNRMSFNGSQHFDCPSRQHQPKILKRKVVARIRREEKKVKKLR